MKRRRPVHASPRKRQLAELGHGVLVEQLPDAFGRGLLAVRRGVTGAVECRYYGRDFTTRGMALPRALIAAGPQPTRGALSKSSVGASAGSGPTEASRA